MSMWGGLVMWAGLAFGQDAPIDPVDPPAQVEEDWLSAIALPTLAEELRQRGVSREDVAALVQVARERRLSPSETATVLKEETRSLARYGRVENLAAFVKEKLEEGLRGKELAAAIRAEHEARGVLEAPRAKVKAKGKAATGGEP